MRIWLRIVLIVGISIMAAVSMIPPFAHCPETQTHESRVLYVATCDTRSGWKEFQALKVWNVTGAVLRKQGLSMRNVCTGLRWGTHGFLTKPLTYSEYIKSILREHTGNPDNVYIILMDSDTFWSAKSIGALWNRFDCARGTKQVVVSTEMSCWIGRYCTPEDFNRWYKSVDNVPSYSPFLNSGVIMGKASLVEKMLDYVIRNNQSYFITYKKHKFDDQYAIADYAFNVAPEDIALDYHQQLAASCSIHTADVSETGWPFVCKHRNGTLFPHCPDYTRKLSRHGYFQVDKDNCRPYRQVKQDSEFYVELSTIAQYPVIWHGNGAGKGQFLGLAHSSFLCSLNKLNMTEAEHWNTFG